MRLAYRVSQFVLALKARPDETDHQLAAQHLTPKLFDLFLQMSPEEQAHSLRVFHWLKAHGANDADLLAAALLHDVGKSKVRMMLWERVLVALVDPWLKNGSTGPDGNRLRSFEVARQHPAWGAAMVAEAGGSVRLQTLVADHQKNLPAQNGKEEEGLLRQLQAADGAN